MDQSIPGIVWIFYVAIPIVGMIATVATMLILNNNEKLK